MEAKFVFKKETPGTRVYAEVVEGDELEKIGSLYLKKHAAAALGNPSSVTVTVVAGS